MKTLSFRVIAVGFAFLSACGGGGGGGGSGSVAPSNLRYSEPFAIYLLSVPVTPNQPTVTGSVDVFTVQPPLPSGLQLDPTTGAITGQPTALVVASTHMITASNTVGSTTFEIVIEVVGPQRFAYVVHSQDSTISIFSIDVTSGRLRHRGYVVADALEAGPERLVVHPSGQFAYVPNLLTGNVSVYAVDGPSGWLDPRTPVACGAGAHDLVLTQNGAYAYVSNRDSDELFAYAVDPGTGELTQVGAPIATGPKPVSIATDHGGQFLFVASDALPASGAQSTITVFAINTFTGALSPTTEFLNFTDTRVVSLVRDPRRDVLQAIGENAHRLLSVSFDPATGALGVQAALPAGSVPTSLGVHPTGRFDYVASTSADAVSVYPVDAQGAVFGSPADVAVGGDPACVNIDPAGKFMYVARRGQDEIVQYRLDKDTGALTEVEHLRTRNDPAHITLAQGLTPTAWVPRFVHVTNRDSQDVTAFAIDPATGALNPGGLSSLAGASPASVAVHPRLHFAFVANEGSGDVYGYFIDAQSGFLIDASSLGTPVAGDPTHLAVDPAGRFLYVVTKDVNIVNDGWIATFRIDPIDASLTQVDFRDAGFRPRWVTIDPTGQFVYVSNTSGGGSGTAFIRVFKVDPQSGVPVASAPDQPATGLRSVAFHPTGRYAYAALRNANSIWQYAVGVDDGALTLVPGAAEAGSQPIAVAASPDGRFAYVAFEDSLGTGHLAHFALSATGQMIEPAEIVPAGLHPIDVGIDPSGRYVYAANRGSNDVSVFRVDSENGQLTAGTPTLSGLSPTSILVSGITQ